MAWDDNANVCGATSQRPRQSPRGGRYGGWVGWSRGAGSRPLLQREMGGEEGWGSKDW